MNTAKIYQDCNGEECTIHQMIRHEPEWAASRIQEGEKQLEKIVQWALNQGFSTGHADNIDSLLDEISLDIAELRRNILEIF